MKKLLFFLLLFSLMSAGNLSVKYLGIIVDSNHIHKNNYIKISRLIGKILKREHIREKLVLFEIFDIRKSEIVFSYFKPRKKNISLDGKIIPVIKKLSKGPEKNNKAYLSKTLYHMRINTIFPEIKDGKIYFLESLLIDTQGFNFNQRKGFPNNACLKKNIPFFYNKPFRNNLNMEVYVWNDKNRFTKQYVYYFSEVFKKLNLTLKEYREDSVILNSSNSQIIPLKIEKVFLGDSQQCRLDDGLVSITNIARDKISVSEPQKGVVLVRGYNKNRANSEIEIKMNDQKYYVKADKNGNYQIKFDLVPGGNVISVKMMDNSYKNIYNKDYEADNKDKLKCKIVGESIIVEGSNKFRKINSNVKIIYNNSETDTALVDNNHKYRIDIPLKSKLNNIAVVQIDGSYSYCPQLRANIKMEDNIYHNVNNMTAEICLVNPDRTSNKITYKYENNTNNEITKNGYRKNGRLCFKVPLKYDRVHNFKIKQLDGRYISHQIVIDRLPTNFVRIKMTFNCDSDVDLHILEPKVNPNCKKTDDKMCKGREIYYNNRRNYGDLDVDSKSKNQGPENYVLDTTTAVKGKYYYWIEWYSRREHFKKYYNKTCSGNLEIVENGQVKNIPFNFFNVSYTKNKQQQIKFSTYPVNKKEFYFNVR